MRQRTMISSSGNKKAAIKRYCPILGELVFKGAEADRILCRRQVAKRAGEERRRAPGDRQ